MLKFKQPGPAIDATKSNKEGMISRLTKYIAIWISRTDPLRVGQDTHRRGVARLSNDGVLFIMTL